MFFMVVYTVMGVQLFHDSEEFERSSFVNFGTGMLTMFQVEKRKTPVSPPLLAVPPSTARAFLKSERFCSSA